MIIAQNIYLIMVINFLIITLTVGLYVNLKHVTFRAYSVGAKNFSNTTLVTTILATAYGASELICHIQLIHTYSLYWVIIYTLSSVEFLIIGLLASRMAPFMQHLSMAETIGYAYGRYARLMASLAAVSCTLVGIAGQIKAICITFSLCFIEADPKLFTITATLIFILYATFGGVRSVTFTDLFQCITFAIILPLFAWLVFRNINQSPMSFISLLQTQTKVKLSQLSEEKYSLTNMIFLIFTFAISYIRPDILQRIYMASGPIQAKRVFNYSALVSILIKGFILSIGLFASLSVSSSPKMITDIWVHIMASIPYWFKGILCMGLLAMAMSTADSMLNGAAVIIGYDIPSSIRGHSTESHLNTLWITRLTTPILGLVAMCLCYYFNTLLDLLRLYLAASIPLTTIPFTLAVFGFRSSNSTAVSGMVVGALSIIIWNKWIMPITGITGYFPSMLANGATMLAVHYFFPQPVGYGWVKVDDGKNFKPTPKNFFLN